MPRQRISSTRQAETRQAETRQADTRGRINRTSDNDSASVEAKWFEKRSNLVLPASIRGFFRVWGGRVVRASGLTLLRMTESKRMIDSWPRFGFSADRGYVPVAQDRNGDLYCVCCRGDQRGKVFHLAFGGDETIVFETVEEFVRTAVHI